MPADEPGETRTQYLPRIGSKISILLGLVLLVAAIYMAVVPLSVASQTGVQFGCGTALSPNVSSFGKGYCSAVDQEARYRAVALLIAALIVAGVGSALFGFDKRIRTRIVRDDFGDDHDYEDEVDPAPDSDDHGSKAARVRPGRGAIAAKSRTARSRTVSDTDRPARPSTPRGITRDDSARIDEDDRSDDDVDDLDYDDRDDADRGKPRVSGDRPRNQRGPRDRR